MKARLSVVLSGFAFFAMLSGSLVCAQELRLLSNIEPATAPIGGGGDSVAPVLSPDGRFVVFASTANNLLVMSNGTAMPLRLAPAFNVFLRDRPYGTNALISVDTSGVAGGNADSLPLGVSADGQFVLFESTASNLVPGDTNGSSDVFVRDVFNGVTLLVSADPNGLPGNGTSRSAVLSPDGRFVAFVSSASNLVPGDTNGIPDVFVRDLRNGTTILASVGASSTNPLASSEAPDITADGRYVAFYSSASNLVSSGSGAGSDIYIRDLQANTTILASVYSRTAVPSNNVVCFNHVLSGDGNYLVYEAAGSDALSGVILRYTLGSGLTDVVETNASVPRSPLEDIRTLDISADGRFIAYVANYSSRDGSTTCIRLWDAQSGNSTIVSGNLSDAGVPVGTFCDWPCLDATGRYVGFLSSATNMATNAITGNIHLYVQDMQLSRRTLVDAGSDGVGSKVNAATAPRLSADGQFMAFDCGDGTLVQQDANHNMDVFVRSMSTGSNEAISAHDPSLPCATPNGQCALTANAISFDGRYLAFASEADNLSTGDTNSLRDIFVADLADSSVQMVSGGTNGASADGLSSEPSISDDGRFVAFTSMADNLVLGDTNRNQDVFVRDLQTQTTTLVSINRTGTGPGNYQSYGPIISSDGRFVLFRSLAKDLAPGTFLAENLFLRDRQLGTNYALSTSGVTSASMTADGRFVAVVDTPGSSAGKYYVWDSLAASRTTNITVLGIVTIKISPDGKLIAYCAGSGAQQLYLTDRRTGSTRTIGQVPGTSASLTFNRNSTALLYTQPTNTIKQLFCYDIPSGTSQLISADFASGQPANGNSDMPAISNDGRFIAYRSTASNIVAGDGNGQPDIFVYDRMTGANRLLNTGASNRSLLPVFSGDGSTLIFASWEASLGQRDFNQADDLFSYTFLSAALLPSSGSQGVTVSWPWLTGKNYIVEFQDSPSTAWQPVSGTATHVGVKGFLQDNSAPGTQRLYRVRCY